MVNIMRKKILTLIVSGLITSSLNAERYIMPVTNQAITKSIIVKPYVEENNTSGNESESHEPEFPELDPQTPLSDEWLAYLQSLGSLTDITDLNDWNQSLDQWGNRGLARINVSSVNDSSIPQGSFGVSSIYKLSVEGTQLTHIDFMQGVSDMDERYFTVVNNSNLTSILGLSDFVGNHDNIYFQFQNNNLSNLHGLHNITHFEGINAQNNQLTDISALSNLVAISREVNLRNNPSLTDISPLANLVWNTNGSYEYGGGLQLDNLSQYTTKIPNNSPFCSSLALFDVNGYNYPVQMNSNNVPLSDICVDSSEGDESEGDNNEGDDNSNDLTPMSSQWLTYLQSLGSLTDITDLNDWNQSLDQWGNRGLARINVSSVNDSSIPQGSFGVSSIYKLSVEGTQLTHIDFMQGVSDMDERYFTVVNNPNLTSIQGLSGFVGNHDNIYFQFQNNNLSNLEGLNNITHLEGINARNNQITDISALSNIVSLSRSLDLQNNPNLIDLSPLANLVWDLNGYYDYDVMLIDNPTQYTTKIPLGSNFCNALSLFDENGYNYPIKYNYNNVPFNQICQ